MAIKTGDVIQGRIAEIRGFGAFVWLEEGKKGLIHISEISDEFIQDIREKVRPNQKVKVKVLSISDDGRIECSLKQAENLDYTIIPKDMLEPDEPALPVPEAFSGEPPELDFNLDEQLLSRANTFEDMMKIFKRMSEENLVDLKRSVEAKRAGGKKPRLRRRRLRDRD